MKKITSFLLILSILLGLAACIPQSVTPADPEALFAEILARTEFAGQPADMSEDGALYYPGLPAGATIRLYMSSGYYADEAALITLADPSDAPAAMAVVKEHLAQKREQFQAYLPKEVRKLDDAVIRELGSCIFVCVTDDTRTVLELLNNPSDPSYTVPTTEETTEATTEATTEPTTEATTEPVTVPPTEPVTVPPTEPEPYPTIISQSGTWHTYKSGVIRVDNHAFETYGYVETAGQSYADTINRVRSALGEHITVYDLLIPTAIGIVFPDDVKAQYGGYVDQGHTIGKIYSMIGDNVVKVNCYDNLMRHRNEYLYFRSDFHWNGTAAYYAYEAFCQAKGIAPATLDMREQMVFDGFLGYLYQISSDEDPILAEHPDTVYAYKPASPGVTMVVTDGEGQQHNMAVIEDVSAWAASSKYLAFAGADNPFTVFTNPNITDGSVAIVVKESFGNAMMSYFVDHYATVYEIDYRYWDGNLIEFAQSVGTTDVIFVNNMSMTRSDYLVGLLGSILD